MMGQDGELIHATGVVIDGIGLLLTGPSGTGKSDLALRLIDRGATLIGDDYLYARQDGTVLRVTAPDRIAGLIEVRGVGILAMPHCGSATIGLVVALALAPDAEQRLPDPRETVIAGVALPTYSIAPFPASAPIKVELLVSRLKERP